MFSMVLVGSGSVSFNTDPYHLIRSGFGIQPFFYTDPDPEKGYGFHGSGSATLLSSVMHNPESDSAVRSTPQILTQWCDAHCWVRLSSGMRKILITWLLCVIHTAELDSVAGCIPWSLTLSDAHCGVMHTAELFKNSNFLVKSKPYSKIF